MSFKVSVSEITPVEKNGFSILPYFSEDKNMPFNSLLVKVHKKHYKTMMVETTRVYLVLEGSGIFTINDTNYNISKHDLFIITDGDTYEYKGEMLLFEFNTPFPTKISSINLEDST